MDKNILEKLQKLLALAASDNEHEASLALEKAQSLMNEHNLTVQDVAVDGSGADIESQEVWGLTKSRQKWEAILSGGVADCFDGRAVIVAEEQGWHATFIAAKTDMALIVDLFERLRQTVRRMSKAFVASERSTRPWLSAKTLHNSYRRGMVQTIVHRLQVLKKNTRPDDGLMNQHGLTGKDLVLVKQKAVDQRLHELFGHIRRESIARCRVYGDAYAQGQEDGKGVSLHQSVDGATPAAITR